MLKTQYKQFIIVIVSRNSVLNTVSRPTKWVYFKKSNYNHCNDCCSKSNCFNLILIRAAQIGSAKRFERFDK